MAVKYPEQEVLSFFTVLYMHGPLLHIQIPYLVYSVQPRPWIEPLCPVNIRKPLPVLLYMGKIKI